MAIDPTTTTTIRVGQLGSAAFNSTDLVPHEVSGTLKKGTLQDLATFIGSIISVDVSVGFRAVQVNDGETLPATDQQEFILVGPGTYPNVGGGATITTTGALNALVSNGVFWFIGVEIPIEVSAIWGDINGVLSDQTDLNDILVAKADLVGGKVPTSQLPSYVDDVIEVNDFASLPGTGETGKIYVTKDTGNIYRWSGSAYIRIADESPVWGIITGTLSDQTDLQNALDGKFDVPTGDTTQYIAGDGSLVTFPIAGQAGTLVRLVLNNSGSTIAKGSVVYINGASGNKPTIAKAIATGDSTSAQTFGLVQANITNNSSGYVVVSGDLIGLNTSAITEGTQLYLSSITAGEYTTTKQYAPAHLVYVGVVTRSHATLGQIEVKIQNGYELDELHDVAISSKTNKDFLVYESSTDLWKNKSLGTIVGGTSSQFIKGDGSLDSTVYLKGSLSANYIPRSLYPGSGDMTNSSIYDNTNGAIGIGVVPSDWDTAWKVLQISKGSYYASDYSNRMGYNLYEIGENTKYISSNLASLYEQNSGSHYWYTAPSGTAGANMTLTPRMILDNSGKLGIGTTSPIAKLDVRGDLNLNYGTGISFGDGTAAAKYAIINTYTTDDVLQLQAAGASNGIITFHSGSSSSLRTERMRITSDGNVGIGTTSPSYKLDVNGIISASGSGGFVSNSFIVNSRNPIWRFGNADTYGISYFQGTTGLAQDTIGFHFGTATASASILQVNQAGSVTVNGKIGIGTTSPNRALTIVGGNNEQIAITSTTTKCGISLNPSNTTYSPYIGSTANDVIVETSGSERMRITSGGNVGIGTTSPSYQLQLSTDSAAKPTSALWTIASDERIKENINSYTKGLNELLKINPITYDYNGLGGFKKGKGGVGIIAQEIAEILPDSVSSIKGKLNETDEEEIDILNFNGHELTYILINAVKEQNEVLKQLKAEIEILKNK